MPSFPTPIALIAFNRPHLFARVFERVKEIRPTQLFFITDGPRKEHPKDKELCAQVREISNSVDWDCKVHSDHSPVNLGCRTRVSSGLDWLFKQVDEAIILEDDCLPEKSFFYFCEAMLNRYRNSPEIMMVSGNNFLSPKKWKDNKYFYSRLGHIWGWATWKRTWQKFDVDIKDWPLLQKDRSFRKFFRSRREYRHYKKCFDWVYNGFSSWAYQWNYAMRKERALSVYPGVNLVANIGFGEDATHTSASTKKLYTQTSSLRFPLKYNNRIKVNSKNDSYMFCYHHDLRGRSLKVFFMDVKLNVAEILPLWLKKILKKIIL